MNEMEAATVRPCQGGAEGKLLDEAVFYGIADQ